MSRYKLEPTEEARQEILRHVQDYVLAARNGGLLRDAPKFHAHVAIYGGLHEWAWYALDAIDDINRDRHRLMEDVPDYQDKITRAQLERQVADLRRQISFKDRALEDRNRSLDAMHYVWCSGGCSQHRYDKAKPPLTEELVQEAERCVKRMRQKYDNVKYRAAWEKAKQATTRNARPRTWTDALSAFRRRVERLIGPERGFYE